MPRQENDSNVLGPVINFIEEALRSGIIEFCLERDGKRIIYFNKANVVSRRPITPQEEVKTAKEEKTGSYNYEIISPLTGTFYRKPGKNEPRYVEKGSVVEKGQTVGLVEAFKIFNEIKTEEAGTVVEILPKDEAGVKEGEVLMRVNTTQGNPINTF